MYEMMIAFPECANQFIHDCIIRIEEELESLGLTDVEIITVMKRNATQPGYNKVVIVTNNLADRVAGPIGDGIVEYPFKWNDPEHGPIVLGVDGKWNCLHRAPDECCIHIRESTSPHSVG